MNIERMKIAYDHQIFELQRYGGISRYFFELACRIHEYSTDIVRVISPLFINEYLSDSNVPVVGIRVPHIPKIRFLCSYFNSIFSPIAICKYNPEIIHETYYSVDSVRADHIKRIITIHDMIHELFPDSFTLEDATKSKKATAARRADHIICVSENTRQDLIRFLDVNPAKISVVYHGYELLASPSGVRRCEAPFILYVGSRGGYKNFDRLLQAYAASPLIHDEFNLVTFGGGRLTIREQARIQELGGRRLQVKHFSGGDEVLADLYATARLFVYPSLYEGFGIPPLEAMSVDCPVICSDRSSLPEVVGEGAGYFDPESVDSIVAEMTRALFDSSYRQSLIDKGRCQSLKYSWDRCAQETLNVYRRVIES